MFNVKNYIKAINHAFPKSEQCSETAFGQRLVKEIIDYGKRVLEIRDNYIDSVMDTAQKHFVYINDGMYNVAIVNANSVFTSDIANKLTRVLGVFATISWCMEKGKVKVGVRSTDF